MLCMRSSPLQYIKIKSKYTPVTMDVSYDLVQVSTMITCRELSSANFVVQIEGKLISFNFFWGFKSDKEVIDSTEL